MLALLGALLLSIGLGQAAPPPALPTIPAYVVPSSLADSVAVTAPAPGPFSADLHLAGSYFGARYYGSKVGRFTTTDPVMDLRANLANPQKWNRYAYVLNNPLRFVDPDGRQERASQLLDADVNALVSGQISRAQYIERQAARGAGAAVGATAAAAMLAGPALATEGLIAMGLLGPPIGQMIAGPFGQVSRRQLEAAANATGPTVNVVTRLSSAPEAGRGLSVAAGEGAEALASSARQGGPLFGASIPRALMSTMERAGLVQTSTTMMNGVKATEYRFLPQASEFVTKFFSEKK